MERYMMIWNRIIGERMMGGRMEEDMRIRDTMERAGWQGYAGREQNGRGRAA